MDDEYAKVAVADQFLYDLRFGSDRAESTTRVYAGELARFLAWCAGTGRGLEEGARHLSRFVLLLRTTPVERAGAGQGRPPGAARVNHVLSVVREFFRHSVALGAVDASVLAALFEVGDDRFMPAELRREGGGLRYRAVPRHRLRGAGVLTHCRRPSGRRCWRLRHLGGTASCWSCSGFAASAWVKPLGYGGLTCTSHPRRPRWGAGSAAHTCTSCTGRTTRTALRRSRGTSAACRWSPGFSLITTASAPRGAFSYPRCSRE